MADAGVQKESNMRQARHDSARLARFERAQPSSSHVVYVEIDRTFRAVASHISHTKG
jgi:hypothetical protein